MPTTLRFRARGTAKVQHYERLEHPNYTQVAYVGRRNVEVSPGQWGSEPTGAAEEVPFRHEYAKACRDGDLWPADEETAAACGVKFDPTFGAPPAPPSPAAKPAEKA